jgi:hypothetical protein
MAKKFDPKIGAATRWKKGQRSPNPGGRPRSKLLSHAYRSVLGAPFPGDKQCRTYAEVIALRVASCAAKGDLRAVAELADRTEGRAGLDSDRRGMQPPLPPLSTDDGMDPYKRAMELTDRLRAHIKARAAMKSCLVEENETVSIWGSLGSKSGSDLGKCGVMVVWRPGLGAGLERGAARSITGLEIGFHVFGSAAKRE